MLVNNETQPETGWSPEIHQRDWDREWTRMNTNEREAIPKEKPEPQMNPPAVKRVWRLAFGVWRLAFGVWRIGVSAYGRFEARSAGKTLA